MNITRLLIAIVAVYLLLWGLAMLFYEVLFVSQFEAMNALMRSDMGAVMPWMLLGYLVQVAIFCYVFTKGYEGKGIVEGIRYGLLLGALLAAVEFVWAISLPLTLGTAFMVAIVALAMWTLAGALLAAIYRPAAAAAA